MDLNLSANNPTKSTYNYLNQAGPRAELTTYTYDADGKPLTRKFDWEDATRSFKYECK